MNLTLRWLTYRVPLWVSRPEADGRTHTLSGAAWQIFLLWLVFLANALLWGGVGIYEAVRVIV